jgi:hypothetical protein
MFPKNRYFVGSLEGAFPQSVSMIHGFSFRRKFLLIRWSRLGEQLGFPVQYSYKAGTLCRCGGSAVGSNQYQEQEGGRMVARTYSFDRQVYPARSCELAQIQPHQSREHQYLIMVNLALL